MTQPANSSRAAPSRRHPLVVQCSCMAVGAVECVCGVGVQHGPTAARVERPLHTSPAAANQTLPAIARPATHPTQPITPLPALQQGHAPSSPEL